MRLEWPRKGTFAHDFVVGFLATLLLALAMTMIVAIEIMLFEMLGPFWAIALIIATIALGAGYMYALGQAEKKADRDE